MDDQNNLQKLHVMEIVNQVPRHRAPVLECDQKSRENALFLFICLFGI